SRLGECPDLATSYAWGRFQCVPRSAEMVQPITKKKKNRRTPCQERRVCQAPAEEMSVIRPNAAGIDIGSRSHWVAVPADRDAASVREFSSFTGDLHRLVDWLASCGITTVAMESTGVYWIPVFELLEERGFEVLLVNAAHLRNVPGRRKSDVLDCQWI